MRASLLAVAKSIYCAHVQFFFSKRNKFTFKRTLNYFPKKYPENANNCLVSWIAVRIETVNITAHHVGCNTTTGNYMYERTTGELTI